MGLCQDERDHSHEVLQEVEPQAVVGEVVVYKPGDRLWLLEKSDRLSQVFCCVRGRSMT